jgi:hypothetical protein
MRTALLHPNWLFKYRVDFETFEIFLKPRNLLNGGPAKVEAMLRLRTIVDEGEIAILVDPNLVGVAERDGNGMVLLVHVDGSF